MAQKLKSFEEWSLTYFNGKPFDLGMKFAEGSEAPPLDFMYKLTELLEGYSMYLTSNINHKEVQ